MSKRSSEDTPRANRVRTVRHQSAMGWWEMSFASPSAALSSYVRDYVGWDEEPAVPLWRIETPGPDVPLIILFASPVLAREAESAAPPAAFGSFVAGLYDRHTLVGSPGRMSGLQANFTPLGARLLLGRPLDAFANRMVCIDDVWGSEGARLTAELAELPGWAARFDRLDTFVTRRIAEARRPPDAVVWTLNALLRSSGQARIEHLAERVGWSRRHLAAQVQHELGLHPKTLARVLRLNHAVRRLKSNGGARLAEIAADCGYYDQAHFSRDFREFTGMTPSEFIGGLLPDAGGVAAR